ncbi:MAG: glycosyltransferase [Mucinivorans sp.]
MRLLFVSHDSHLNGGAQKCLFDLVRGIKVAHPESEIYMIFPAQGDMIEQCQPYITGYKIIKSRWWLTDKRVSLKAQVIFVLKALKAALMIALYCHKVKPDYGLTNTVVFPSFALSCRLLGIKHIWFIHEMPLTWSNIHFMFNQATIFKWVNSLSSKILVTSNYSQLYYQQYITPSKVEEICQAVEFNHLNPLSQKHPRYTISLIGTFDLNKGQMELLEAINRIVDQGRDIHCQLIGNDCGTMEQCKAYIEQNKLSKVVSIIPFTNDIQRCYWQSDVVVVCSTSETFGRVAVEAQKCGLPLILSNVGAHPARVKDGINGLLYQKGNIGDLVNKIEQLRDSTTRLRFANGIKASELEKYSMAYFVSAFVEQLP